MIDLQKHSRTIALALLGEPNKKLSTADELRWNKKGSLSINIRKGTFTNFEDGTSGGMIDLIKEYHADPISFLNDLNLGDAIVPKSKTNGSGAKLSGHNADKMKEITKDCEYRSIDRFAVGFLQNSGRQPMLHFGWEHSHNCRFQKSGHSRV